MPDNSERDIEKQLRASAEQRRAEAGAPFELHEVTRQALQAEVARQYGKPQDRPGAAREWWWVFWPRLAVATPLAVLLIASIIWFSSTPHLEQPSMLAAAADKSSLKESEAALPPATTSTSMPVPVIVEEKPAQPPVTLAVSPLPELRKEQTPKSEAADAVAAPALGTVTSPVPETPKPATRVAAPLEIASADTTTQAKDRLDQSPAQLRGGGGFGGGGAGGFAGGGGGGGGGGGRRGGFGGRPATSGQGFAESNQTAGNDSTAPATLAMRTEGETNTRRYAAAPTQAPALARETQTTQATSQNETASTWFFRNSVASPTGRAAGRGGRGGIAPARAPAAPASAVLNSFRFEQSGNELRIVDEDGSVYVGQIQAQGADALKLKEAAATQGPLETRARLADEGKQTQAIPQALPANFNVTGLNRSLSQQVIFTGQLQQAVSFLAPSSQTSAVVLGDSPLPNGQPQTAAFRRSQASSASNAPLQQRIIGRAKLSDSRELPVDAFQIQR